jgi:hypothetical protein
MSSIYSYNQQKALFWVPKLPGLVSIACSSLCIYHLLLDRKKRLNKVYGRLWLGISLTNILVAFMAIVASLATPKDTGIYGAFGNETSCSAMAATFSFVFVVCMGYNGALAVFYNISIHTKWTGRVFSRRVEPWLHIVPVVYALTGAIVGLSTNMFATHDMFLYCWAAPAPYGCRYEDDESCVDGNNLRAVFVFVAGLVELNLLTMVKAVCTFSLYYTVSKQERLMQAKYHANKGGSTIARETGIQAILFGLACIIPYGFTIAVRIIDLFFWQEEIVKTVWFFWFVMFSQFMFPMQGMVNTVCYFRPKIKERQRRVKDESAFHSFLVLLEFRRSKPNRFTSTFNSSTFGSTFSKQPTLLSTSQQADPEATDLKNTECGDDVGYVDVAVLEKVCAKCNFVLGEEMIGDVQEKYLQEKQRLAKITEIPSPTTAKRITMTGELCIKEKTESDEEQETESFGQETESDKGLESSIETDLVKDAQIDTTSE